MKLYDLLIETITQAQLKSLEQYADKLFAAVGIDVQFTRHFFDRVNDPRNIKPITDTELLDVFRKTYQKYGKQISQLGPAAEAVITDMQNDINMPFVLNYDAKNQQLDLVTKTIMRKKNFQTPNQKFKI
jgi:homoserine dehydrogenase